jgi:leader peptidase (prepilin peptidase)/N-methyltransferase
LPIAGWLLLRGKCRDCKAAISPRYPLVELTVALLFVAAAYLDVYRPTVEATLDPGPMMESAPDDTQLGRRLLAMLAHIWAGCTLIAALLIACDGQRVPWRLILAAVVVAAAATPFLTASARWPLIGLVTVAFLIATVMSRRR